MTQDFSKYSRTYDKVLNDSLGVARGLDKDFFDLVKVSYIERMYGKNSAPLRILDYGCGGGSITALMAGLYGDAQVDGYDVSEEMIAANRAKYSSLRNLSFIRSLEAADHYDLVTVTNVIHHVDQTKRESALQRIRSVMGSSARACFFEHNPVNPFTRWIVNRCEFDVGVRLVWPSELRRLAAKAALDVVSCSYILHFPFKGEMFRIMERALGRIPAGAQYFMVMAKSRVEEGV